GPPRAGWGPPCRTTRAAGESGQGFGGCGEGARQNRRHHLEASARGSGGTRRPAPSGGGAEGRSSRVRPGPVCRGPGGIVEEADRPGAGTDEGGAGSLRAQPATERGGSRGRRE